MRTLAESSSPCYYLSQNKNSVIRKVGWAFSRESGYPPGSQLYLTACRKIHLQSLVRHMFLELSCLWKPFISVRNCASLHSEWRWEKKKINHKPTKKTKKPKESSLSHHLLNRWAARFTPIGCFSDSVSDMLSSECPSSCLWSELGEV